MHQITLQRTSISKIFSEEHAPETPQKSAPFAVLMGAIARILPLYTTSLLFTLFCQSGTYPFLDIGIVRCDWLRSKPKQSKFDQELLEMSQTHMLISKNVNNDVTMNYCWFSVSRHSKQIKIKIKTMRQVKSRIWQIKGGKYTKTLAKI